VYYIDDFTLYKHSISTTRGKISFPYYKVHIYNAQQDRFIFVTKQHKEMKAFYQFITATINNSRNKGNLKSVEKNIAWQHGGVPKRRNIPVYSDIKENPYKPVYGAAFSTSRTPINHAEDFKDSHCHDITAPIYDSKYQSIESDQRHQITAQEFNTHKPVSRPRITMKQEKYTREYLSTRDNETLKEMERLESASEILKNKQK